MEQYIIPANSKRSQLIFNIFRPIDLAIFLSGGVLSMLFLFVLPGTTMKSLFIKLAPLVISVFLVLPMSNYHNTLVLIREILLFFTNRRVYLWRGWCMSGGTEEK